MALPHWTGGNRRIVDLEKITYIMVTLSGVTVFPMALNLPHSEGAELIWNWVTPPWKKIYFRVINKWTTEPLNIDRKRILDIILEAIEE